MEHESFNLPPRGGGAKIGLLADASLTGAIARLQQRAERQEDNKVLGTFVDTGVLTQLKTNTNQVFFGRRGTGKTHVMRALKYTSAATTDAIVLDLDLRTLGSSAQFSDLKLPIQQRALTLFRDLMIRVIDCLRVRAVELNVDSYERALGALGDLEDAVTWPMRDVAETNRTTRTKSRATTAKDLTLELGLTDLKAAATSKREASDESEATSTYSIEGADKLLYSDLTTTLSEVMSLLDSRLLLLLDEWGALPTDVQPFLAEHIRHALLPTPSICLKIASLEHRSCFSVLVTDRRIGIEIGADVFIAADLDEHYVQQRRANQLDETFANVLWNHLRSELSPNHFEETYGIRDADALVARLFDGRQRLSDLAGASFGIVRDFLSVFSRAFFEAQRKKSRRIDAGAVSDAIHDWFVRDKFANLPGDLQDCVGEMLSLMNSRGNANVFCLPVRMKDNRVVQHLVDARVIHVLERAYTVGKSLGAFHWLLSVDYGLFIRNFSPRDAVAPNTDEIVALLEQAARRYDTPVS